MKPKAAKTIIPLKSFHENEDNGRCSSIKNIAGLQP